MLDSLHRVVGAIRRDEVPLAVCMFLYFFLVITSFWILKPIKKGLFIQFYDRQGVDLWGWQLAAAQAELLAKVMNMGVAVLAVIAFTWLSRHYRRQHLTYIFVVFFIACYVGFGRWLAEPAGAAVWSFYLFGDLFNTLMVASFFAFLNDSVDPHGAKRLYGLVGLGGVMGGVFGSTVVSANAQALDISAWLWLCCALAVCIALAAWGAATRAPAPVAAPAAEASPLEGHGNPALEGARLVARSRYLLSIVAIVGLYEVISTILDFQFTFTVAHYLDGPAIGRHFALVYSITNWVSMAVQLFLTGYVLTRFGVGMALLVLPCAVAMGSSAFLLFPVLWAGSLLNTVDNGFSYSINQSAKEALYVPTTAREKYSAKAFIDMFVQRAAKAVAVGLSLGMTLLFQDIESLRYLSVVTLVLLVVWVLAARFAGRQFARAESPDAPAAPTHSPRL